MISPRSSFPRGILALALFSGLCLIQATASTFATQVRQQVLETAEAHRESSFLFVISNDPEKEAFFEFHLLRVEAAWQIQETLRQLNQKVAAAESRLSRIEEKGRQLQRDQSGAEAVWFALRDERKQSLDELDAQLRERSATLIEVETRFARLREWIRSVVPENSPPPATGRITP